MTTTENTSALVQLYTDTKAYIESKGAGTSVVFGRKARWHALDQGLGGANRVIFIPGRITGEDGELGGVDGPGETLIAPSGGNPAIVKPRALYLQAKILTVSLWAANTDNDPSASIDEAAQQQAIEQLQEWVYRSAKHSPAGSANIVWTSARYSIEPNVLRFGTEYILEAIVGSQYYDDVPGFVFPTGPPVVSRGAIS